MEWVVPRRGRGTSSSLSGAAYRADTVVLRFARGEPIDGPAPGSSGLRSCPARVGSGCVRGGVGGVAQAGPVVAIAVLGALRVEVDGREVEVAGRRERNLLALLAARRGGAVSAAALIEGLWGDGAPASAAGSLQVAVSRLRSVLEPGRLPRAAGTVLVSTDRGYELRLPVGSLDAEVFGTRLDGFARLPADDAQGALVALDAALGLWRGDAYADFLELAPVREDAARLEDLRLLAAETRLGTLAALGRHAEVAADAEPLVRRHPFRERLTELLALALYRTGRQADALAQLRLARGRLADELGVDPSPALRRLEADVLGHAGHLSAASVRRVPAGAPRVARTVRVFGRSTQLAFLDAAIADVAQDRGALVIVAGEPGIGKTHLVGEFARRAAGAGVRTVWGRCHEAVPATAFWPWTEVLRAVHDEFAVADPLPPLLARGAPDRGIDLDPATAPLRVYDQVTRYLGEASRDRPLAIVLEDLHWADPSSLHLLRYAADELVRGPVLLVVTLRDTDGRADPALAACLADLARAHPVRLALEGLGPADTRALIGQVTGADVDDATADAVFRRAGGNPFFTRELARLMTGDARTGLAAGEVPDGVRDVVRRRVATLPESARVLLQAAAVVGRDFGADLLVPLSRLDVDTVADALDAAAAHGILDEVTSRPGTYRFTHDLVRDTMYGDLGPARRLRLHAGVGTALDRSSQAGGEQSAEVAHHLLLGAALDPTLTARAVRHCVAAATRAGEQFAYQEACDLWQRAADAAERGPDVDARARFAVWCGLGVARRRTGDLSGSREALRAAIELARALGDAELLAGAAVEFGGPELWNWRDYAEVDHHVVAVLEQCRDALPAGDLRVRVTASLAVELVYTWDAARADALSGEAVVDARRGDDPRTLCFALGCRFLAIWRPGTAPERLALAQELASAAGAADSPHTELMAHFLRACALLELGRTDDADADIVRCEALAAGQRHTSAAVQLAWWRCMRRIMAGAHEDANAAIPAAADLHRRTTVAGRDECEGTLRAEVATAAGALAAELPALAELARRSRQPIFRAVIARAALAAGERELAAELLPAEPSPTAAGNWASLALECLRTEVLAGLGRADELRRSMTRLTPHADAIAVYGSIDTLGSVHHFLGCAAQSLGDRAAAAAHFTRSVAINARVGVVPWHHRSLERLALLVGEGNEGHEGHEGDEGSEGGGGGRRDA